MSDHHIEIRTGRKLHIIQEASASSKTIFFLPGLGGRAEQFRPQIDFFKQHYNIIAPDLFGLGQSVNDAPPDNQHYSFMEMNKDIQAIFAHYQTEENYVVGHSYGGAFASSLALNNPDTIKKLVLIAPVPLEPKIIPKIVHLPLFILKWLRPLMDKNFVKLAYYPTTDPALITAQMAETRKNDLFVIKSMMIDMAHLPKVDISKIAQPTLVMTSAHDGIVTAKQSEDFYKAIPKVEFKKVDNAAHLIMLEQPLLTNQLIYTFLG